MSEERKTKTDAAAPASAALERIDRKDAFLQALHTFLTAHQGTEWAVAAVDIQHFKLYNELYGTEKGDALLETVANCLLGYSRQTGYPVGYFGNDDFFLCLPDEKAEQLSEELDFSYSHDTLTGLANRSRYEADLRELPNSGYESVVCTYIDVVGMHEVNEHLGHRSGDTLLCCLANAARKFFATSRVYRIGSDEFVILTPNEPPYSVWSTADRMRAFLKEKDYVISVGIQQTADLRHLDEAVAKAEAAMRQDRQAYYDHNGRARQLEGLNEKMERTLQEKRDAEHFLKVLAPKYKTVIVVDLQEDTVRPVIVPDDFQSVLDTCGGSFRAALTNYRDKLVAPEDRENFAKLFDFGLVRSTVFSSNLLEHRYRKTDGRSFCIRVTPYSRSGSHINEVLWIFADEEVE